MHKLIATAIIATASLTAFAGTATASTHKPAFAYVCGNFQAKRGYTFQADASGTGFGAWHGFNGQVIGYGTDEHSTIYPDAACVPHSWY